MPRFAASISASARSEGDLFPDRNGYSFGRWEGDKLIVETTHLKEAVDQGRYPHSENAKIVEEYTLVVNDDGTQGADVEDDDDGSRVLHAADHGREEVAVPARRALVAVRVQRAAWEEHLERLRQSGKPTVEPRRSR